jgi:hypothetical protein
MDPPNASVTFAVRLRRGLSMSLRRRPDTHRDDGRERYQDAREDRHPVGLRPERGPEGDGKPDRTDDTGPHPRAARIRGPVRFVEDPAARDGHGRSALGTARGE